MKKGKEEKKEVKNVAEAVQETSQQENKPETVKETEQETVENSEESGDYDPEYPLGIPDEEVAEEVDVDFSKEKEEVLASIDRTSELMMAWDKKDPRHFSTHAMILQKKIREFIENI